MFLCICLLLQEVLKGTGSRTKKPLKDLDIWEKPQQAITSQVTHLSQHILDGNLILPICRMGQQWQMCVL